MEDGLGVYRGNASAHDRGRHTQQGLVPDADAMVPHAASRGAKSDVGGAS